MKLYKILVGEGEDQRAIYLNLDHVVEVVVPNHLQVIVRMSNGKSHEVAEKSVPTFLTFLNASLDKD